MQTKQLPNNETAEKTLIGFLLDGDNLHSILAEILPEDLYQAKNRIIFSAASAVFSDQLPVDILTVSDQLTKDGNLDKVGGVEYLRQCLQLAFSDELLDGAIVMVKDAAMSRHGYSATVAASNQFINPSERAEEILANLQSRLVSISSRTSKAKTIDQKAAVMEAYERIEAAGSSSVAKNGINTGYTRLDFLTGGLQRKELILLAARPSMGKTSLMLNIARNAAGAGRGVYIFTLEMSAAALANRMIFTEARVDSHIGKTGRLKHKDHAQDLLSVSRAMAKITELPIWYNETSYNIAEICSVAKREYQQRQIDLLCIDYIGLISSGLRGASRNDELGFISGSLKRLGKELDIPVLALSQLSRINENQRIKRPTLNALRDSGNLEQDADAVIFIHSDDYYNRDNAANAASQTALDEWKSDVIVEKQRNGPTDTIAMLYRRRFTQFVELVKNGVPVENLEPEQMGF